MSELRVIRVSVATEIADLVTDLLWQFGPEAVSETASSGETSFVAGYRSVAAAAAAHSRLSADHDATLEAAPAGDDWIETWRRHEPSHDIGPLHLRLPEHPPRADTIDIVIEPGATFGFSHPSTLLALDLITTLDLSDAGVADVGSGSGVLAVAASRLGAGRVDAVDIDPAAVEATEANASTNGAVITTALGSVEALPHSSYDVIIANMLAHTLVDAAAELLARLAPGGALVLSGLLATDHARVAAAFAPLTTVATRASGDWLAIHRA